MKLFSKFKNQIKKAPASIPSIHDNDIVRYQFTFYGKVQGVGFRVEVYKLANKLNLTGMVKNENNGSVTCQLQGSKEKIDYLIHSLQTIKRIHIEKIISNKLSLQKEHSFDMKY